MMKQQAIEDATAKHIKPVLYSLQNIIFNIKNTEQYS